MHPCVPQIPLKQHDLNLHWRQGQNSERAHSPPQSSPLCQWHSFIHHKKPTETIIWLLVIPMHLLISVVVAQCPFFFCCPTQNSTTASAVLIWTLIQAKYPQTDRNYPGLFQTVSKGKMRNLLLFWSFFYLGTSDPQVHIFQRNV